MLLVSDQTHPKSTRRQRPYALYLAVIPFYRQHCIDELLEVLGSQVTLFTGRDNIDPTVTTGIRSQQFTPVRNRFPLRRKLIVQTGQWRAAVGAGTTIFDLNPRNLTVWGLCLLRRVLRRRTLLWGHLHPRSGAGSKTNSLRRLLRRCGNGTVLYSYNEVSSARKDLPQQEVWVAPNALYRSADLIGETAPEVQPVPRTEILYVGRLVQQKKVDLLLRGYALSGLQKVGVTLAIVGAGAARDDLQLLADELGCGDSILFTGSITDARTLRGRYASAICSVSPGYAGLSLTQSLGFGVPMLVADDEPHAPEIELARFSGVTFFTADNPASLASALRTAHATSATIDPTTIAAPVRQYYSAEAMAQGLADALTGERPATKEQEWSQ